MSQHDKDVSFFVVWLLNCVADALKCEPREVYRKLQAKNIVVDHLISNYDVLHTMGREALVEEVVLIAKKRGVEL
ncbi:MULTISPECIES: DUF3791 domain-containing protein [unclassified Adlercreutzia]|uniref:DUF3791 domain-containing protein n=1 Tax=unclassified Adlercreutzia TaxID=2636013 RepID=UPI0013EA8EBB|nr:MULTISPECIES: DUF3791 domain-containing protein [unclassified Adlercreutzia]